ncbi:D-alanyl-D-alanine carboxypeptidase [Patescibacteria group bacterium]|nr:D-alanyl-D-alanine carboxypeptidase [Patescibacteria group bacterium]
MKAKRFNTIKIAHIALALSLLIGSFSLFSITFGLQKTKVGFYTSGQDQTINQKVTTKTSSIGNLFSFARAPEEEVSSKYLLQRLEKLGAINASSFLVGDLDTGEVIFERKPFTEYPIASVTKYMTAYTAADTLGPNELADITEEKLQVEGNRARFKIGDTLTIRELLYPLLLVSSNDAAEIIARERDRDDFIREMNINAERLGMHDTAYEDPTGLSKNNHSTARDLFVMMRAVRDEYPQIIDISRLSFKENDGYLWQNINRAASFPEFRGGKTGYTNAARQTSIGYYQIQLANDQTKNIAVIILQSDTREQDTRNILEYLKRYVAYL